MKVKGNIIELNQSERIEEINSEPTYTIYKYGKKINNVKGLIIGNEDGKSSI